jgi:hypothetical protein
MACKIARTAEKLCLVACAQMIETEALRFCLTLSESGVY